LIDEIRSAIGSNIRGILKLVNEKEFALLLMVTIMAKTNKHAVENSLNNMFNLNRLLLYNHHLSKQLTRRVCGEANVENMVNATGLL
jgi:hypothetical protein